MYKQNIKTGIILFVLGIVTTAAAYAQQRQSPMKTVTQTVNGKQITITYSSPSVKGREIWGALVPYNKVWRTGANEATTIELSEDCTVGGKLLKKGKYALFTIPNEQEWTIIINEESSQWGAYKYDPNKDLIRFKATAMEIPKTEAFDISVTDVGKVSLAWDKLKVSFDVQ